MPSPKWNEENIKQLVVDVLESWDESTLIDYAYQCLFDTYLKDQEQFLQDWENQFGDTSG